MGVYGVVVSTALGLGLRSAGTYFHRPIQISLATSALETMLPTVRWGWGWSLTETVAQYFVQVQLGVDHVAVHVA